MRKYTLLFILLVLVSGCSSTASKYIEHAYQSDPSRSEAMNVLMASGVVFKPDNALIKDVPYEQADQIIDEKGNNIGDMGFSVTNLLNRPVGVGLGLAGAMSALSLVGPNHHDPEEFIVTVAWVPQEKGRTEDEAKRYVGQVYADAIKEAAEEILVPQGYSYKLTSLTKTGFVVKIHGNMCSKENTVCQLWISYYNNDDALQEKAPDFIGSYPSYRIKTEFALTAYNRDTSTYHSDVPAFDLYRAISKLLPHWVYLYLPPFNSVARIGMGEDNGFLRFPVVMNQGKVMLFVAPQYNGGTVQASAR